MMEFFESDGLSIIKYFRDLQLDLGEEHTTRLYANFDYYTPSIKVDLYDDRDQIFTATITHRLELDLTWNELLTILNEKLSPKIKKSWIEFLSVMDKIVMVEGVLSEDTTACDTCGDYTTEEFLFLFFPGDETLKIDPAVGFKWNYGCFGGEQHVNDYQSIQETCERIKGFIQQDDRQNKKAIKKCLSILDENRHLIQ